MPRWPGRPSSHAGVLLRNRASHERTAARLDGGYASLDIDRMILVATDSAVLVFAPDRAPQRGSGLDGHPTCLTADPRVPGSAWCGTHRGGVFRTDDAGASWYASGLADERLMSLAAGLLEPDVVWAGTEPSAVWRSADAGMTWERTTRLDSLPSSSEWAFPPRPETHHVRWIACHPSEPGRLWVAVEAGALISTENGGRTWRDRVAGGPYDTHELAVHPAAPDTLRVAAGDGYYESHDGGATWTSPRDGFDVGYLRSVAIDPGDSDAVLVSASSGPRTAYVAGRSDGRIYRRGGTGSWERVSGGWPAMPRTIAPLLLAGAGSGELWAADERGLHRTGDGGINWEMVAPYPHTPQHLRGIARVG
jgi:photosystem II stability/assembly factor-like uncharacterized protein